MEIERLSSSDWQRLKHIRLASLEDAPDAFGTTLDEAQGLSEADWRQQAEDLPTFIAVADDTDVSMARGAPGESKTDAYLISMWVSPAVRGRRVGEQLVNAVINWAQGAGFTCLLLDVADDNPAAIALYERLDFRPTGETSVYPPPRAHIKEHQRARSL